MHKERFFRGPGPRRDRREHRREQGGDPESGAAVDIGDDVQGLMSDFSAAEGFFFDSDWFASDAFEMADELHDESMDRIESDAQDAPDDA